MDFDHLIIDGYNLLHQDEAYADVRQDIQLARQKLVRRVEQMAPEMARRISVVFDGREKGRDLALEAPHIEVLFSPANRTADAVIERMVAAAKHPERMTVVTSDRIEAQIVSAAGAMVMSCESFVGQSAVPPRHYSSRRRVGSTLGDFFPE